MTIQTLDIPVETIELAHWLESQLVSDRLGALVAELRAARSLSPAPAASLKELLGGSGKKVLQAGLTVLPESQLRRLFQFPDQLFELQEWVLVEGGEYWDTLPRPGDVTDDSRRNWQSLQSRLQIQTATTSIVPQIVKSQAGKSKAVMSRRGWIAATAATFTVGLGLGWLIPRANPIPGGTLAVAEGMAWTRRDAFRPAEGRKEFLLRLATLAGEWFDARPDSPTVLASRILEFRNGCARLQLNAAVIPEADRDWLLSDCRKWSDKLDQNLIALEEGRPLGIVQQDVDATIHKLVDKLRTKAQST